MVSGLADHVLCLQGHGGANLYIWHAEANMRVRRATNAEIKQLSNGLELKA